MDVPSQATSIVARMIEVVVVYNEEGQANEKEDSNGNKSSNNGIGNSVEKI